MDTNPNCVPYGEPEYWEQRYTKARKVEGLKHSFDWYCPFEEIWPTIETFCGDNNANKVLVLGCGNSLLSEGMYSKGFNQICSMDISPAVINNLQHRYQDKEGMEFLVGDVQSLARFDDMTFDIVVEKAMIDSIFCSVKSYESVLRVNQEVYRVLKPSCTFVSVSCGPKPARMPHYGHKSIPWEVDCVRVPNRPQIRCYLMTRQPEQTERYGPLTDKECDFTHNEEEHVLGGEIGSSMGGGAKKGEQARIVEEEKELSIEDDPQGFTKKREPHISTLLKNAEHTGYVRLAKVRDAEDLLTAYANGRIRMKDNQIKGGGLS